MKRYVSLVAVAVVVAAGSLSGAQAAVAEEWGSATVLYSCVEPPLPGRMDAEYEVSVKAPAAVRYGESIRLEGAVASVKPLMVDVIEHGMNGSVKIAVGGSATT